MSGGTSADGDGDVVQLGYYDAATVSSPFAGNFVALINNLQNSFLGSSRNATITVDAAVGDYILYAFPSSFGSPTFSVGGFAGGFHRIATNVAITNQFGISLNYDIWQSDNSGLGSTTVVVS